MRYPYAARAALVSLVLLGLLSACVGRRIDHRVDRTKPETGRIGFTQRGHASWYGGKFHGRATASGEIFDKHGLTAAHRELPLGTWVDVTHLGNGRTVRVKVNDRGPFIRGRMLDLSRGAAQVLGMINEGVAEVRIRVVPAPPDAVRTASTSNADPVYLQVGAFRDRDGALDVQLALAEAFGEVTIVTVDGWHRVRVGPFPSREAAETTRLRLRRRGHEAVVVGSR